MTLLLGTFALLCGVDLSSTLKSIGLILAHNAKTLTLADRLSFQVALITKYPSLTLGLSKGLFEVGSAAFITMIINDIMIGPTLILGGVLIQVFLIFKLSEEIITFKPAIILIIIGVIDMQITMWTVFCLAFAVVVERVKREARFGKVTLKGNNSNLAESILVFIIIGNHLLGSGLPGMESLPGALIFIVITLVLMVFMIQSKGIPEIVHEQSLEFVPTPEVELEVNSVRVRVNEEGVSFGAVLANRKVRYLDYTVIVAAIMVCCFVHPVPGVVLLMYGVVTSQLRGGGSAFDFYNEDAPSDNIFKGDLPEGAYRIYSTNLLGWKDQIGVGTCYKGTFHTSFHVVGRGVIKYQDQIVPNFQVWPHHDVSVYCGPWRGTAIREGSIQLVVFTPDGKTVRVTGPLGDASIIKSDKTYHRRTITADFPTGSSGSPIINSHGELVGLYGYGVDTADNYTSIISHPEEDENSPGEVIDDPSTSCKMETTTNYGTITWYDKYPGWGKTFKLIPAIVERAKEEGKKVWILAPTRVVKDEIKKALASVYSHIGEGFDVKPVNVLCHASAMRAVLNRPQNAIRPGVYVMDEAHFQDPSSIALRGYLLHLARSNYISLSLLTATPPKSFGPVDSNFPIEDIKFHEKELFKRSYTSSKEVVDIDKISSFLKEGERGIFFVPSEKAGRKIVSDLKDSVLLCRSTFDAVYPSIKEKKPTWIVTTNIAEMGANLDADIVVNWGKSVQPTLVENNDTPIGYDVWLQSDTINWASYNQRRGRIGRRRCGRHYYFGDDPIENDDQKVCWREAQMLLDQLPNLVGIDQNENSSQVAGMFSLGNDRMRSKFLQLVNDENYPVWDAFYSTQYSGKWCVGEGLNVNQVEQRCKQLQSNEHPLKIPAGCPRFARQNFVPTFYDDRMFADGAFAPWMNHFFKKQSAINVTNISYRSGYFEIMSHFAAWLNSVMLIIVTRLSTLLTYAWYFIIGKKDLDPRTARKIESEGKDTLIIIVSMMCLWLVLTIINKFGRWWFRMNNDKQSYDKINSFVQSDPRLNFIFSTIVLIMVFTFYWMWTGHIPIWAGMVTVVAYGLVLTYVMNETMKLRTTQDNMFNIVLLLICAGGLLVGCFEMGFMSKTEKLLTARIAAPIGVVPVKASTFEIVSGANSGFNMGIGIIVGCLNGYRQVLYPTIREIIKLRSLKDAHSTTTSSNVLQTIKSNFVWGSVGTMGIVNIIFVLVGITKGYIIAPVIGLIMSFMMHFSVTQNISAEMMSRWLNTMIGGNLKHVSDHNDENTNLLSHTAPSTEFVIGEIHAIFSLFGAAILCYHSRAYGDYLTLALMLAVYFGKKADLISHSVFSITGVSMLASVVENYVAIVILIMVHKRIGLVRGLRGNIRTLGLVWKEKLSKLSQERFNSYRNQDVVETHLGDYVSRGGVKMNWLIRSGFNPCGIVYDLGCGRGGWSQRVAMESRVSNVFGYTFGQCRQGHEIPCIIDTYGNNVIVFKENVNVYDMKPKKCDTVMCDIGEEDPNPRVMAKRTLDNLDLLENWLKTNPKMKFCFKIMFPGDVGVMMRLNSLCNKMACKLVRTPFSRNSTSELYLINSEKKTNQSHVIFSLYTTLIDRFKKEVKNTTMHVPAPLKKGPRSFQQPDFSYEPIRERVELIKKEYAQSWHVTEENPYKSWKYIGSYATTEKGGGGTALNLITSRIFGNWRGRHNVANMTVTDTSPDAIGRMFTEKLDQYNPPRDEHTRRIAEAISDWTWEYLRDKKGVRHRLLSYEEAVSNFRLQASVGGYLEGISWQDAETAFKDKRFQREVELEFQLHGEGRCRYGCYNTMGKREKKASSMGRAKSSRLIWYLPLLERVVDAMYIGCVNVDHWANRETLPSGVGQIPVHYLGYIIKKNHEKTGMTVSRDTAGWDTRIDITDIKNEQGITKLCQNEDEGKKLRNHMILVYENMVCLVKRKVDGRTLVDVIHRKDFRGSGQAITYFFNTKTNNDLILGTQLEAIGALYGEDQSDLPITKQRIYELLDENAERWMDLSGISGDDSEVSIETPAFASSYRFAERSNKPRKDKEAGEPDHIYTNWEDVDFCSHHFHNLKYKGINLVVPCKAEDELVGRCMVQLGKAPDMKESACLAKAYANMFLLCYFHKRDVFLGALGINSIVPSRWVPTGRTTYSIHASHEWMNNEDMLEVWNRVWIQKNPYLDCDRTDLEAKAWNEIPFLPKRVDRECGSQIGVGWRSNWAKTMPHQIHSMRKYFPGEEFTDYYTVMNRYSIETPGDIGIC